jgi:hypothetical protein
MSAMGRPSRRGSERLGGELHDVVTLSLRGDIPLEELRRDLRGAAHPRAVRPYGDGRDTGIGATWVGRLVQPLLNAREWPEEPLPPVTGHLGHESSGFTLAPLQAAARAMLNGWQKPKHEKHYRRQAGARPSGTVDSG